MLDPLFKPRSVGIVGASTKELSIGNVIIKNLQQFGYKGKIYPIHPTAPEVRGLTAYASLAQVPGEVDLAHIILPSRMVPQVIEECGQKGIRAAIINSAGFSEMGEQGATLQRAFLANAAKYGVRIFGPNCQGIINTDPDLKAYCNFTFTYPAPGAISVVALSGGVGAVIMQALADLGVGMRMYASNGNASDISIPEILRYWSKDAGCRAIILYTEGFSKPREFLAVAQELAGVKPVLAMKAGRTVQGAKAASSHTGSLAGVDIATELIFEKTGILSFDNEEDMVRAAQAFATQPIPAGNRVGIITNTGGPAVIATDVFGAMGLDVPKLSAGTIARLQESQLPEAALENPIDVVATASGAHFRAALDALLDEEGVDCIFVNFVTAPFTDTQEVARQIAAVGALGRKPIVCNFMTDLTQARFQETRDILKAGGIPCYAHPTAAAKAMAALVNYGRLRRRSIGQPEGMRGVDEARAASILQQAQTAGRMVLSAQEVYGILEAYGMPVAPWRVVENAEQAVLAAEVLGFPVVVKVDAEDLSHKSDQGGVAINLKDSTAVRGAVGAMQARLGQGRGLHFLVQKFLPGGREWVLGASPSRGLGHLLMFGLGGIHVEVLKDVCFKVAPVTRLEAEEMLRSIKAKALLDGHRGEPGVDRAALVDLLLRLSQLVTDLPAIQELDLNPVLAFEQGAVAVDGRIRILPVKP